MPDILLVEDEHALAAALEMAVRRIGAIPHPVASGAAGLALLERRKFDAAVVDIGLPDMSGLRVLEAARRRDPGLPVLVITAHGNVENAIAARQAGATDYQVKPLDLREFQASLRALLVPPAATAVPAGRPAGPPAASPSLVGGAPSMQRAFLGIAHACASGQPALLTGPPGAGKSHAAALIHATGTRAGGPLCTLSCTGLDESALERALTGSAGGTLILEDIERLPLSLQAALSGRDSGPQLLALTTADLRESVRAGAVRADLFYLLSVLTIPLPPLTDRRSDIPALSAALLGAAAGAAGAPEITPAALDVLLAWDWPGNVRELRHVLEYALAASRGGPVLPGHLPPHLLTPARPRGAPLLDPALAAWLDHELALAGPAARYDHLLSSLEDALLRHLLARFDHKPSRLAAALGIHRTTLRTRLQRSSGAAEE